MDSKCQWCSSANVRWCTHHIWEEMWSLQAEGSDAYASVNKILHTFPMSTFWAPIIISGRGMGDVHVSTCFLC